jgi:hypothetical protein
MEQSHVMMLMMMIMTMRCYETMAACQMLGCVASVKHPRDSTLPRWLRMRMRRVRSLLNAFLTRPVWLCALADTVCACVKTVTRKPHEYAFASLDTTLKPNEDLESICHKGINAMNWTQSRLRHFANASALLASYFQASE